MKTLTTLLFTLGLCALTLPAFSANESCDVSTDGALNVADIVQMVNAILGGQAVTCAGPGCDITSDNAEVIAAAMPACDFAGGEVWDGSTCATPESSDPAPNCFLMGLCGQDGAASYGIPGPYSQMSSSDALFEGSLCVEEYGWGLEWWWMTDVTYGPAGVCM